MNKISHNTRVDLLLAVDHILNHEKQSSFMARAGQMAGRAGSKLLGKNLAAPMEFLINPLSHMKRTDALSALGKGIGREWNSGIGGKSRLLGLGAAGYGAASAPASFVAGGVGNLRGQGKGADKAVNYFQDLPMLQRLMLSMRPSMLNR